MRRLIVFLALIGASAFFFATPGTASAGNCSTIYASTAGWYPPIGFTAYIGNCSGVSRVQFGGNGSYSAQDRAGWFYDGSTGGIYMTSSYSGALLQNSPGAGATWVVYYIQPWCGGADHWASNGFTYRIESFAPNYPYTRTWGPWHQATTGGYVIKC